MDFKEYQEQAAKTAIYRNKIIYPALGLIDELGEFIDKHINRKLYDKKDIISEIGDVYWYIAALCTDTGIDLKGNSVDFNPLTVFYSKEEAPTMLLKAIISASAIAGKVKKWMRDDNMGKLSKEALVLINISLDDIFCFLAILAYYEYDINHEEIFKLNVDKLNSRLERGVIHGSGDNR